jgi:hypothetical protein
MLDIAQSGKELKGSFLFGGARAAARAPKFHYTTSRTFCQVKNAKKLHKSHS